MAEPSSSSVNEFLEFVAHQCDIETAIQFLKGNNGSVEQAVGAWYDNPDPARYIKAQQQGSWDESQFNEERAGGLSQSIPYHEQTQSFQIDNSDDSSSLRPLGAPSRPPSRTVVKSSGPHKPEQYEGENAAINASLRLYEQQETGIIKVPAVAEKQIPDQAPQDRRREPGEPVLLKPLQGMNHLPSLITILHSIPICREAFLFKYPAPRAYEWNKSWWCGSDGVEATSQGLSDGQARDLEDFVVQELQMLMAFLDQTDRSYGSAARLSKLLQLNADVKDREPLYLKMLAAWDDIADTYGPPENDSLFATREVLRGNESDIQLESHSINLGFIKGTDFGDPTLYDALDNHFWDGKTLRADGRGTWLKRPAPIVVIRVAGLHHSAKSLTVPGVLYVDRYMESNIEIMQDMAAKVEQQGRAITGLRACLEKVQSFVKQPTGQIYSTVDLTDTTVEFLEHRLQLLNGEAGTTPESVDAINNEAQMARALKQLSNLSEALKARVKDFENQILVVTKELRPNLEILTRPSSVAGCNPIYAYALRGVAKIATTGSSETYILHSTEDDVDDAKQASSHPAQWWRLIYDTSTGAALVTRDKIPEDEVLKAAGEFDCSTLLVYGTKDLSVKLERVELVEPLKAFIAQDNAAFETELDQRLKPEIIEGYDPGIDLSTLAGHYHSDMPDDVHQHGETEKGSDLEGYKGETVDGTVKPQMEDIDMNDGYATVIEEKVSPE